MDILIVGRLLLAAVFAAAGIAKLADRAGARQAVIEFGIPARFAATLAIGLPVAELAIAAALLPAASAFLGAVAALALLIAFTAAIGVNLARRRKPTCRCFGQLHAKPIGWTTVARNAALAAIAGFIVAAGAEDPGPSATAWLGELTTAQLAVAVVAALGLVIVAAQAVLLLNLVRRYGRLLLRLDALDARLRAAGIAELEQPEPAAAGVPIGTPAPRFSLEGLHGETLTLDALRAPGSPVLLVFSDPDCSHCTALLPAIASWQRNHAGRLTVAVVSRGSAEANRAKVSEHAVMNVLVQRDREVAEAYHVEATPAAVLVLADGTIASGVVPGNPAIGELVSRTLGLGAAAPEPEHAAAMNGNAAPAAAPSAIGEPAPRFRFRDLNGRKRSVPGGSGRPTVLLFWNPSCGFCQRMLDDLRAWEADRPADAPALLVVSSGSHEANRALGLRSPIVLDDEFAAGTAYGAGGTPAAVLVDAAGQIASEVAVGAPAVFALLGGEPHPSEAPAPPPAALLGDVAPDVRLPNVEGEIVDLADFRGERVLLLFWNPACGFCAQMLDDLRAWDASPPTGGPKLLVVSTGRESENEEMHLRSPVLLDRTGATGAAFGANGTPMGVLVDEHGRIASEVAAGATAVFALAGEPQPERAAT